MDVDNSENDNFYDKIGSFMPTSFDYNLEDIDEILRSANSDLDGTLDFSAFNPTNGLCNFNIKNEFLPNNEFELPNLNASIPAQQKERTNKVSATTGNNFNADEFLNFLNDDSIKFEDFTRVSDSSSNSIEDAMQSRNTPSPTGSCSSSGGSSTSGIQSDASSIGSMTPSYVAQTEAKMMLLDGTLMDNETSFITHTSNGTMNTPITETVIPMLNTIEPPTLTSTPATTFPTTTTVLQPVPQFIQGTLIPVKTVPIQTITPLATVKPGTSASVKVEPVLTPKTINTLPTVKLVTNNNNANSAVKVTPPPNTKPKTIFLSSNDFKTLMQRMNSNVTKTGGAKISGAINGQMPKIIMKTPNGKVITTNKIVQPLNGVTKKIVTTNGSQQAEVSTTKLELKSPPSESSIYKGMIDEKIFKKQQRMIKNRESASLSRKKKKEYVVSLEARINNLEKENYTLKGENKSLRSQLVAFAQTCNCKHSNISEFILNSLNAVENKPQPVKIAPKPATKNLKQRMTAANIKKNVAVLFAMAFMVTLNVGNFQNFLNKNSLETNMAEQTAEDPLPQVATAGAGGRRILWAETEAEYNEKINRSKRELEMDVPPLHFLRPINRTTGGQQRVERGNTTTTTETNQSIGMNQTENLRLASSLRKWIGGKANFLNLSMHEQFSNDDLENPTGFKPTSDYYDMKTYDLPLQQGPGNGPGSIPGAGMTGNGNKQKRKFYVDERLNYAEKQRKIEMNNDASMEHSLELFKPKISEEYLRLFNNIKRQDDTFYVLSFNMDHILLPASNYNKSTRPKMSLMLPAGDPSLNGDMVLMQIDCEVTNTTELMLKSHMIPEKLRPTKYTKNPNDVANNETAGPAQKSRDHHRFYTQTATNAAENDAQPKRHAVTDKYVVKQKPVVRTYYLMGPKTQAAADAAKKKPTIIKLNGNETIVNGILSVKNSTLFTKMRETVTGAP